MPCPYITGARTLQGTAPSHPIPMDSGHKPVGAQRRCTVRFEAPIAVALKSGHKPVGAQRRCAPTLMDDATCL